MKKTILIIILAVSALTSRAQTVQALADSSFAKQDYNKAFDLYSSIVKDDPTNLKDLRRRAYCMMNLGDELNSTRFWSEALKVSPNDPVANYYMGVVFMNAAKEPNKHSGTKSDFKAKAELYLNKAANNGSEDAKSAIAKLNGI